MNQLFERIKRIPAPIWIGIGVVVLLVLFLGSKRAPAVTGGGAITGATVGTQGAQPNAGADQAVGNLSQTPSAGFQQLGDLEKQNNTGIAQVQSGLASGVSQSISFQQQQQSVLQQILEAIRSGGNTMVQAGGAYQGSMNNAPGNAPASATGQPVHQAPAGQPGTSLFNV